MELCDCSLSMGRYSHPFSEVDALRALYQVSFSSILSCEKLHFLLMKLHFQRYFFCLHMKESLILIRYLEE